MFRFFKSFFESEFPSTFHGTLAYVMKGRCTVDQLTERIPISRSTVLRLRTVERKSYNLDQLVAICVGLQIPYMYSTVLLARAGIDVQSFGKYSYYAVILSSFYRDTIDNIQLFLKSVGHDPLNLNFDEE